jgi:hypothetical protein
LVWLAQQRGAVPLREVDDRLLGLWDDFTVEEAEALAEARPGFAHTLALGAVLLLPRPSRDVLHDALQIVAMAAAGNGWEEHSEALVSAWIAKECEPFSAFNSKSWSLTAEQKTAAAQVDRKLELMDGETAGVLVEKMKKVAVLEVERVALTWPQLLSATTSWHKAPLGVDEAAVASFISRVFVTLDEKNFPIGAGK